jgi:hypothetical protein
MVRIFESDNLFYYNLFYNKMTTYFDIIPKELTEIIISKLSNAEIINNFINVLNDEYNWETIINYKYPYYFHKLWSGSNNINKCIFINLLKYIETSISYKNKYCSFK